MELIVNNVAIRHMTVLTGCDSQDPTTVTSGVVTFKRPSFSSLINVDDDDGSTIIASGNHRHKVIRC